MVPYTPETRNCEYTPDLEVRVDRRVAQRGHQIGASAKFQVRATRRIRTRPT